MPPIESGGTKSCRIVTIFREKDWRDAAWAMYSWLYWTQASDICFTPVFYVDGHCAEDKRARILNLFPKAQIREASEVLQGGDNLSEDLKYYYKHHIFARKTSIILHEQNGSNVLFTDPDILVFRAPVEVVRHLKAGSCCHQVDSLSWAFDPWLKEKGASLGLEHDRKFNSGIMAIPKGSLDNQLITHLFEGYRTAPYHRNTGQTLFSILLTRCGSVPLPEATYTCQIPEFHNTRDRLNNDDLVLRHYTGPVRHVMYQNGIPYLLKQLWAKAAIR